MMKYAVVLCFILGNFFSLAYGQLSGQWKGIITQNEGGYKSEYQFEMYFHQKGNMIHGRSYVYVDDIFVEMEFEGIVSGENYVKFQETKLVEAKVKEGMEWCIKGGYLILKKEKTGYTLSGIWNGLTSFSTCIPGRIELKRIVPQV